MTTKVDEIGKAVEKILTEYQDATEATMKKAVDKASRKAVKELKENSPRKSGTYGQSWTAKVNETVKVLAYEKVVFNRKRYWLTQVLEKGPRKRPHIAKAEQDAVDTLVQEIKKNV